MDPFTQRSAGSLVSIMTCAPTLNPSTSRVGSSNPVRKGAKITVKGRLRLADWEKRAYVGHPARTVAVWVWRC